MTDDFLTIDLSCLTDRQREVIEMHYSHCVSFGAIAELLGISKSSVQSRHDLAITKLRRSVAPYDAHHNVDA